MIWLRRGVVLLLSLLLFATLVGGVGAVSLNLNFRHPTQVEAWLHDSGLYDKATQALLVSAQKDQDREGGDGSVSLKDPAVVKEAKQAFTPQLFENNVNTFINANYAWLQGKTPTPQFNIDFNSAKEDFATRVGNFVTARLKSLPPCTPSQQMNLQFPIDSLNVKCRPSTLDPQKEGDRVAEDIRTNNDFIKQPVITAKTLNPQADKPARQAYYAKLSGAPKVYKIGEWVPVILAALALLLATGIIYISVTKRRGWRRIGVVLILSGLVLVTTKFAADIVANHLEKIAVSGSVASQLKQPRDYLINRLESQVFQINFWFGVVFIVAALAILITLWRTRHRKPAPPAPVETAHTPEPLTAAEPATTPPVKTSDELPPLKQPQPTRPKRPLIQG